MKKIFKKFRLINIDVYVYVMSNYVEYNVPNFKHVILKEELNNKTRFYIENLSELVHESYLYSKVFLLKSIGKNGPIIGDCFTNKKHRGQSIYPYVINYIAKEVLENNKKEIFIVVNRDNSNSIIGIEKAGFNKFASIKAKRWLWFYFNRQIEYSK